MASVLWIPVLFTLASFYLYFLAISLPVGEMAEDADYSALKYPSNLSELNALASLLTKYTDNNMAYVFLLFCSAYVYKQAFAIPGSVFLNLLSGALFGVTYGFPLTCVLSAVGATCCYGLSHCFGKHHVDRYFGEKIKSLSNKVQENRDNLFFFLLSLRLFPIAPNWLMNMAAPIVGVPVHLFFFSVLFGLMPYNFICVEAGSVLSEITSTGDIFTASTTLKLALAASFAILPSILIKRCRKKEKIAAE